MGDNWDLPCDMHSPEDHTNFSSLVYDHHLPLLVLAGRSLLFCNTHQKIHSRNIQVGPWYAQIRDKDFRIHRFWTQRGGSCLDQSCALEDFLPRPTETPSNLFLQKPEVAFFAWESILKQEATGGSTRPLQAPESPLAGSRGWGVAPNLWLWIATATLKRRGQVISFFKKKLLLESDTESIWCQFPNSHKKQPFLLYLDYSSQDVHIVALCLIELLCHLPPCGLLWKKRGRAFRWFCTWFWCFWTR